MKKFYQCNGCLDWFTSDNLQVAEVQTVISGKMRVLLCGDCQIRYAEMGLITNSEIEAQPEPILSVMLS